MLRFDRTKTHHTVKFTKWQLYALTVLFVLELVCLAVIFNEAYAPCRREYSGQITDKLYNISTMLTSLILLFWSRKKTVKRKQSKWAEKWRELALGFGFLACVIVLALLGVFVKNHVRRKHERAVKTDGVMVNAQVTSLDFVTHYGNKGDYTNGVLEFSYEFEGTTYQECMVLEEEKAENFENKQAFSLCVSMSNPRLFMLPE